MFRSQGPEAFRDRVVAVTGGASGIGRALGARFLRAGARVALLDRDAEALTATARALADRGEVLARPLDVTDEAACRAAMADVAAHFGGIDVLAANAGISQRSLFAQTEVAVFRRVMEVNFFGALHCAKAALDALLERRGQLIVTSSIAGFAPLLGRSGYCASKHALQGCFETLRCELRERGVHVLIVCPGFTATGIERSALDGRGERTPRPQSRVGRQARPEAVAEAIVRAAARRRRQLVLSPVGRLTQLLVRLAPSVYERVMTGSLREELAERAGSGPGPAAAAR